MHDDIDIQEKRRLERIQELSDLKAVIDTPEGFRLFCRIMDKGKLFRTTFTGEQLNSAYAEGYRNFALMLFRDIVEAAPDKVASIIIRKEK